MMRESPQPSTLPHQTWPIQSVKSFVSGTQVGSPLLNQVDKRVLTKTTVLNGIHCNQAIPSTSAGSKLPKGIVVTSAAITHRSSNLKEAVLGIAKEPSSVHPRIQWTTKDSSGRITNLNSWLTSQKYRLEGKSATSSPSFANGNAHHGFDLTKLYPELSAKLGLTKSTNEGSLKASSNKQPKDPATYTCAVSKTNSGTKSVNVNFKKLLAKSHLKGSSIHHVKSNSGGKVALQNISSNFVSVGQTAPEKTKETKLNLTKIPEDKLRRFLANQPSLKKLSLVSKRDSKSSSRKSKSQSVYLEYICDRNFSGGTTYPPASGGIQKPNVINILPRKVTLPLPKPETLSPLQLRVHKLYQENYAYKSDLFPLGLDPNECDTSEDDDTSSSIKNFSSFLECLYSEREATPSDPSHSQTLKHTLGAHRRQVIMAKERLRKHEQSLSERWALTRALLEAARANPHKTASTLSAFVDSSTDLSFAKKKLRKCQSSLLVKRLCAYEVDDDKECGQKALPGTRHCIRHITYNVDQQLFSQCSARTEDNILCRIPTFDVLHDSPLCQVHGENVEAPQLQIVQPKAKRPRKKSKMPVLSRYGKRSKKRRRSSFGGSTIIPSTSVRPPINSPGVCLGSPQGASPLTPRTSPSFSTSCSGKADESEFEDELEGMIENFPLDAASKLLENPADLQDVLNKIPEEEISQIFYDTESKAVDCTEEDKRLEKSSDDRNPAILSSDSVVTSSCPPLHNSQNALTLPLDVATLSELTANGSIDSIISSSFNQQELNTISQVLSNYVQDESLNLDGFQLVDSTASQNFSTSIIKEEEPELKVDENFDEKTLDNTDSFHDDRRKFPSDNPPSVTDCKMSIYKQTNKLKVDTPPLQTLQ